MENIKILQKKLLNHEAFMVSSDTNRFYLTGFRSSSGKIIITKDKAVLFVDFRYYEAAKKQLSCFEVFLYSKPQQIKDFFTSNDIKNLFIETDSVSINDAELIEKNYGIKPEFDNKMSDLVLSLRQVKSENEINKIISAQQLTDATFDYILPRITKGRTEREIMLDMEFFMRKNGSEGVPFDFIVVSGENTSLPHGVPNDRKVQNGDFITMDFGAVVEGYCSDMTRTVAMGSVNDTQRDIYNTVLKAQKSAINVAFAGEKCSNIDAVARKIIENKYSGSFGHGLGHGVGIEVHELPNLNTSFDKPLEVNNVVTIEPGIYLENCFGVRIEDMLIIKENKNIDITKSSKELIIL